MELHELQIKLLKKLSKTEAANFNKLLLDDIESEHMNYHLKRLIKVNLVKKFNQKYILTDSGKNYVGLIDDERETVEKQPKTSILLYAVRKNPKTGEIENLMSKRLKHPYYGKVGKLTGKVRFGETFLEAAKRELLEETGLKANNWHLERIYHKLRHTAEGKFVQDTIFYCFFVTDFEGKFIEKTEFQENIWVTNDMIKNKELDFFDGISFSDRLEPKDLTFDEDVDLVSGY